MIVMIMAMMMMVMVMMVMIVMMVMVMKAMMKSRQPFCLIHLSDNDHASTDNAQVPKTPNFPPNHDDFVKVQTTSPDQTF